jgi:hypothetical protein
VADIKKPTRSGIEDFHKQKKKKRKKEKKKQELPPDQLRHFFHYQFCLCC